MCGERDEKGSVTVVVALMMVVLLGFAAFVIDLALLYVNRAELAGAADAAALAGVLELPEDPSGAVLAAREYAVRNGVEDSRVETIVSTDMKEITVRVSRTVEMGFARILGQGTANVAAEARARMGVVNSVRGAVPFGVVRQNFVYGMQYTLKYGPGDPEGPGQGNYGALALGGEGADNYRENFEHGYSGLLTIGQAVLTEPGNMSGATSRSVESRLGECTRLPPCTYDDFERGCPRLVIAPIIDHLDVGGRDEVMIEGFAAFFLEGATGSGNNSVVLGRFIKWVADGTVGDGSDFGLRAYRLVN